MVVVQFCDATTAVQTKEAQAEEIQFLMLLLLLIAVCFVAVADGFRSMLLLVVEDLTEDRNRTKLLLLLLCTKENLKMAWATP